MEEKNNSYLPISTPLPISFRAGAGEYDPRNGTAHACSRNSTTPDGEHP
jgi:hypothetical protein